MFDVTKDNLIKRNLECLPVKPIHMPADCAEITLHLPSKVFAGFSVYDVTKIGADLNGPQGSDILARDIKEVRVLHCQGMMQFILSDAPAVEHIAAPTPEDDGASWMYGDPAQVRAKEVEWDARNAQPTIGGDMAHVIGDYALSLNNSQCMGSIYGFDSQGKLVNVLIAYPPLGEDILDIYYDYADVVRVENGYAENEYLPPEVMFALWPVQDLEAGNVAQRHHLP